MHRFARATLAVSALSLGLMLAGCGSWDQFDPTDLFSSDIFVTKKKLPGERQPVFPEGTPGVPQGVPAELIKGHNQQAVAEPETTQAIPEKKEAVAEPEKKPKAKPKPKPKVVAKPAEPSAADQRDGEPVEFAVARSAATATATASSSNSSSSSRSSRRRRLVRLAEGNLARSAALISRVAFPPPNAGDPVGQIAHNPAGAVTSAPRAPS